MKPLLSVKEAATYTGVSTSTLNKWRMSPGGPMFIRIGPKRIAYARDELDRWLAANTFASTRDYQRT